VVREEGSRLVVARTHCFVCTRGDTAIVAFAGTDPIDVANWITNFTVGQVPDGTTIGHEIAAASVWPVLKARLQRLPAGTHVFVTGHSLGGALAVLIARNIVKEQIASVAAVYTFGMPRAGNRDFASTYNAALGARTFRLVHGNDLVPTVAPSFLNFQHVGRFLHCERLARFATSALEEQPSSDQPPFVQTARDDLLSVLRNPFAPVKDAFDRLKLAVLLAMGRGPADARNDFVGAGIETLPPRIRDHIPDRYIAACGGP
jgi:triacylglycerol lipase